MGDTRIGELASIISSSTSKLEQYFKDNDLPSPSFDVDAPKNFGISPDATGIDAVKRAALNAAIELQDLLTGPSALLRPNFNATSLQFIYRYNIPAKIPLHGTRTFGELAEECGVSELDIRRILRFAIITHRVFCEPVRGTVAHSAASRLLLESQQEWDMAGLTWDEDWPAFARSVDALQLWGDAEPNHTGHNLAFNTEDNLFDFLEKNPEKSRRFNSAISLFASPGPSLRHMKARFPWQDLAPDSTIVDVGGGSGSVSIHLAEAFDQLKFIVQDLPDAIAGKEDDLPDKLKGRIKFMEHDFFTPQPIIGDVYILRAIFHNWPDHYCVKILRQLRPALRKGAKLVIQDGIMPGYGELGVLGERNIRGMDMLMMTLFNAREREEEDWKDLFKEADCGFTVNEILRAPVGTMGLLILEWTGESKSD